MFKRLLAPFLMHFLVVQTAEAQLKFNASPMLKFSGHKEFTILSREDGGYAVFLKTTNESTLSVKLLDRKLQLESEFPLVAGNDGGTYIQQFITIKGKYYLVYGIENRREGDKMFMEEFNSNKGTLSGKPKEMVTTSAAIGCDFGNTISSGISSLGGMTEKRTAQRWDIVFSPDSSLLLIRATYMPKSIAEAKKSRKMNLAVFDVSLKKQWSKDVEIGFDKGRNSYNEAFLDNNGNVYLNFSNVNDNITTDKFYRFTENSQNPEVVTFPFPKKSRVGTYSTFDKQGNLCVLGGYSDEKPGSPVFQKNLKLEGAYCIKVDFAAETSKRVTESYKEISAEVMQLGESRFTQKVISGKENKGNANLKKIYFKEVIPSDDGSFFMLFEQYEEVTGNRTASDGTAINDGVYRDIYVVKVSKSGQIDQIKKINKWQRTYKNSTSYYAYVSNHELHFLITDNPNNINLTEDQEPKQYNDVATIARTDGAVFDITLKSDGTVKRSLVLDFKTFEGVFYFEQNYIKTANHRLVKFDYPLVSGFSFNKGGKFYIIEIE